MTMAECIPWDPRDYEGENKIQPAHVETDGPEMIEIDLGATLVERLWGVDARKAWLEAYANSEDTK